MKAYDDVGITLGKCGGCGFEIYEGDPYRIITKQGRIQQIVHDDYDCLREAVSAVSAAEYEANHRL